MDSISPISSTEPNKIYSEFYKPAYVHFKGAEKEVLPQIVNAGIDNFLNLMIDAPGINGFTRASGCIEGGVNIQPLSSFKHREFAEKNGYYPDPTVGYMA